LRERVHRGLHLRHHRLRDRERRLHGGEPLDQLLPVPLRPDLDPLDLGR
jgi:hypothetical protein